MTATLKPSRRLLVIGILSLALFLLIAGLVFSGIAQSLDASIAQAINNTSPGPVSTLMIFATNYGREYFWAPVVLIMLLFGDRNTKLLAFQLAALFIIGLVSGEVLKALLHRSRPYDFLSGIVRLVPPDSDSSFPSGHALIVTVGAAFTVARFKSRILSLLLTLEAGLVCYSRVYVGVHYPLDVTAGALFAITIVGIGLPLIEKYMRDVFEPLASGAVRILREGPLHL